MTGRPVLSKPTDNPVMIFVACPVTELLAILYGSIVVICVILCDGNEEERHDNTDACAAEEVQVRLGSSGDGEEVFANVEEAHEREDE